MSNNSPAPVRKAAAPAAPGASSAADPRVARTTHALGRALIELIQERAFDDITVQQILDRAGVARATFYAHYRNKQDVLHSSYERLFAAFEPLLDRPSPRPRLFPVAEFLAHVKDADRVLLALRGAGQMDDAWALCTGYAARIIERRIAVVAPTADRAPRPLVARMLAGALMESVQWWQLHQAEATPAQMDHTFHEMARAVLVRVA